MDVVDKLYNGYGEGAPDGHGPDQGLIGTRGHLYLEKGFPKLDTIRSVTLVPSRGSCAGQVVLWSLAKPRPQSRATFGQSASIDLTFDSESSQIMSFIRLGKREVAVQEESGALESVREVSLDRSELDRNGSGDCRLLCGCGLHDSFSVERPLRLFPGRTLLRGLRAASGLGIRRSGAVDCGGCARYRAMLFGDSLHALRFFPALAAGAKMLLTGWIVRELGGRRYAQILAAAAMLMCPIYLTMDNFLSMNAFEPVFWMLCVAISLRIVRTGNAAACGCCSASSPASEF